MDFSELVILMAVALILFGPEDLPKIARALGKAVFQIRKFANEFTKELQNTVNDPVNVVNKAFDYQPQPSKAPVQTQKVATEQANAEAQGDELLAYEEADLPNSEKKQLNDPLAGLPSDMVSYEKEGASR